MAFALRQATQNTGTTSAVVTKPAGTVDGDLLVAFAYSQGATSFPAGWTTPQDVVVTGTRHAVFGWKVASGEGASYTFTGVTTTGAIVMAFSGGDPSPYDTSSQNVTATTAPSGSSITVANANSLLIWGSAVNASGAVTQPSGFTEPANGDIGIGAALQVELAYVLSQAAGATGAQTGSIGTAHSAGTILAAFKMAPATFSRAIPAKVAVTVTALKRATATKVRVSTLATKRAVPAKVAVRTTSAAHAVATKARVLTTSKRAVPASARVAVLATKRAVPTKVAVRVTAKRVVPASVRVATTSKRVIPAKVAVRTTTARAIGVHARVATSATKRTIPASVLISIAGVHDRAVPVKVSVRTTTARGIPAKVATRITLHRAVPLSLSARLTLARSVSTRLRAVISQARAIPARVAVSTPPATASRAVAPHVLTVVPATTKAIDVFDDFDDGVRGAIWATDSQPAGTAIVEAGGVLTFTLAPNAPGVTTAQATTANDVDLSESAIWVRVVGVPSDVNGAAMSFWHRDRVSGDGVYWQIVGNGAGRKVQPGYVKNGVDSPLPLFACPAYSATTHACLRIRHHAGQVYFEYSANAVAWSTLYSTSAYPLSVWAGAIVLRASTSSAIATPGTAIWDTLNIGPVRTIPARVLVSVRSTATRALPARVAVATTSARAIGARVLVAPPIIGTPQMLAVALSRPLAAVADDRALDATTIGRTADRAVARPRTLYAITLARPLEAFAIRNPV